MHLNVRPEAMDVLFKDTPEALSPVFADARLPDELLAYQFELGCVRILENSVGFPTETTQLARAGERFSVSDTHEVAFYQAFAMLESGTVWEPHF
jgi:hypothetical protein